MLDLEDYHTGDPVYVLVLRRNLYGLKQPPRNWHQLLVTWLINQRSTLACSFCVVENCNSSSFCNVDDLVYAGTKSMIDEFKTALSDRFKGTHDGALHWILGMEVIRDRWARACHNETSQVH